MGLAPSRFQELLAGGRLDRLFNELGWDQRGLPKPYDIAVDGERLKLLPVAEKRGVMVLLCSPDQKGLIPDRSTQLKVEKEAAKLHLEHLLIFSNEAKSVLTWLWVSRTPGQPKAVRSHTWRRGTSGEALRQKLEQIVWSLEAEEAITLTDVITGLRRAFDRERVTRAFYDRFKAEHDAMGAFVKGLRSASDTAWYASLMLNRLMFVYFIQRKGFLDGDPDYLANRLRMVQQRAGKGKFLSFYRQFLRRLFHEGLGQPESARSSDLTPLLGNVPYLNGGLFALHELEEANPDIDVPDEAFERLFRFFDSYSWHLDDRPLKDDREINPDVLGYIFEKYINQKQMGAYYTKEDITGYIARSVIVAHLLERSEESCPEAFSHNDGEVWTLLAQDPDRYIPAALSHGADSNLKGGGRTRKGVVAEAALLPNETTREAVRRLARYSALRLSLADGTVKTIEDLISLNLDSSQLVQDIVENTGRPDLLRAIWTTISGDGGRAHGVRVLDPTCGSGAFLFAALNVLEPIYVACLERMAAFIEDAEGRGGEQHNDFRRILAEVEEHPSRSYYVYKTIILNNLFGVDVMGEAVEICKLRLFLKMVAQVDSRRQLEPLPDIDFNIRTGNALVGYATEQEFDAALGLASDRRRHSSIKDGLRKLSQLFAEFRTYQTGRGHGVDPRQKVALRQRLSGLVAELDSFLAHEYGIDPTKPMKYAKWREDQQPLHWFAEFYAVLSDGGFDVIIGNPPYVEVPLSYDRNLLRATYRTALPRWSRDEDLYTLVTERSLKLLKDGGKMGMILPLSLAFSTKRPFVELRQLLEQQPGSWWWSHFDRIPSALFGNDVRTRCTIALYSSRRHGSERASRGQRLTTALTRWTADEREHLFELLNYSAFVGPISEGIPKVGSRIQAEALDKLYATGHRLSEDLRHTIPFTSLAASAPDFPKRAVFVGGVAYNWLPAWRSIPKTTTASGEPSLPARTAGFAFDSDKDADAVFALLCSSLGYWWWVVASDGFNLKRWLIDRFPISFRSLSALARGELAELGRQLRKELEKNYVYKENRGRIGNYYLPACAAAVEDIDTCLAKHIPALAGDFFEDVRAFNASFSTAQVQSDEEAADSD